MGNRNAGVGRDRYGGCDTGNDFEFDAGFHQLQGFFRAPPEHEGVSAFQAHDHMPLIGLFHQEIIDFFLGHGVLAGFFAHIDFLGIRTGMLQDLVVDEVVVQYRVSLTNETDSLQRYEFRVAGSGADQIYFAFFHVSLFCIRGWRFRLASSLAGG